MKKIIFTLTNTTNEAMKKYISSQGELEVTTDKAIFKMADKTITTSNIVGAFSEQVNAMGCRIECATAKIFYDYGIITIYTANSVYEFDFRTIEVEREFVVKRLNRREDGYESIAYFETAEKAIAFIKDYKKFYNPIDIYYTFC